MGSVFWLMAVPAASFSQKMYFGKEAIKRAAYPIPLQEVRLLDSPFKQAMDKDGEYLLSLEPDRLLHRFRVNAGLQPKGDIYGGWESRGISGHSLGHYLSACSMMYAATGDERFREKVVYTVNELVECQRARGTGYVGAIPKEDSVFNDISHGIINSSGFDLNGAWVPWYTIHKIMAGLLDAYTYADVKPALQVDTAFANWAINELSGLTEEQFQKMLACEHGGMNEVLASLYAVTNKKKYLDLAERFNHKAVLEPLANRQDSLTGLHANTQIPKIIGVARQYELTGNKKDSVIAGFFWDRVVYHHSYVIGGNSEYEHFGEPDHLSNRLSEATAEGCNSYNMLKLTRHLFSWSPQAKYMDYYERTLYNHILASLNPENGMVCYFMPLGPGTEKKYGTPFNSFWCCTGTGMENHARYGESIYYTDSTGGLLVNLFIPSELNWKEKGVDLKMSTDFPGSETVRMDVARGNSKFSLKIRCPGWVAGPISLKVNGEAYPAIKNSYGYIVISRNWKKGDSIVLSLPMGLYSESMPDDENLIAFLKGPIVLAGDVTDYQTGILSGESVLVTDKPVDQILQPGRKTLHYRLASSVGPMAGVELKPFYSFHGTPHVVYWDRFTSRQWEKKKEEYEAQLEHQQQLEAATVDILRIGEMQPERDHNLQSENSIVGEAFGKKFRHAENGWFEFDMKVADVPTSLMVTYWGGEVGDRHFNILANGKIIANENLHRDNPDKFFTKLYPIPSELIKNKKEILIRFEALPGNIAGGVYGVRTVKSNLIMP